MKLNCIYESNKYVWKLLVLDKNDIVKLATLAEGDPKAHFSTAITPKYILGGARSVMVIVTGYGHGNMSSIPVQDWLHFP